MNRTLGELWPEAALSHYRTRSGAEVDFVLEVGREAWGIEIKASRRVDGRMLSGLSLLSRRSDRCARRIVVFFGARCQLVDGVEAVPLEEFLAELPS